MPVTHRHAVHDGKKGLSACIKYCTSPSKTGDGKFVTAINCSKTFAVEEFLMIHAKFNSTVNDQERICYHAWQSFDFRDSITPAQVHEIGVRLCKELYPDFQCIVSTHLDKGHLHNHIIINSRNLEGRKLEDRLANTIEGLYGLRDASDKIAEEYGCKIVENAPKIGHYKSKKYNYLDKQSIRKSIIEKIEEFKETCNSFDELLEHLSFEGYIIKQGKHIALIPPGKQKSIRFYSLGKGYDEKSLKQFFFDKKKSSYEHQFEERLSCNKESKISANCKVAAEGAKSAILKSEHGLDKSKDYPKYFNARYMEMKRYYELVEGIKLLNDEGIYTYDDLALKVSELHAEIEMLELNYKKDKSKNNTLQARMQHAKVYIENYNQYCIYEENKNIFDNVEISSEVKDFLQAKKELNNASLEEVREFLAESSKSKQQLNKQYARISYLKHKITTLDKIRVNSYDENPMYIKSIKISNKMIESTRSDTMKYCIRIPYTQQFVMIDKECCLWKSDKQAIVYLRNDEQYDILNHQGQVVNSIYGEDLVKISLTQKEIVIEQNKL